ncbi:MAG TPA: pitrilysin family protein [Candidatus Dormibacteraeota bacterium]|nr:pitrilysin family protein [Candidatus Dormibacteraeota bacterium]
MYAKTTLPSGLRIVTEQLSHVRSATIGVWADVGSSAERAEQRGISHLIEHMLFKGTTRRSTREIAETMDGVGAQMNAFTDKEQTCYYARVIDTHVELAIDVLADMYQHPVFEPDDLAREQSVVLEEIKMYDDSPDEMIHDLFIQTMWEGSNLGAPTIGYAETVSAQSPDDLRAYMRERYAPNTTLVAVAGNVEHERIVELVARHFSEFSGSVTPPVPDVPALRPAQVVRAKDSEQAYLCLGTRGLAMNHDRKYALAMLDTILGGGMSSRLFQEIREKRGLVYSVYTFQQAYRGAGLFGVYAGTSPKNAPECIKVVCEELSSMASRGPTDAELTLAKEHVKGSLTLSLESSSNRMIRLGRDEFSLGRRVDPQEIIESIDAVQREDVTALAHELFATGQLGLCVLGPVDADDVRLDRPAAVA